MTLLKKLKLKLLTQWTLFCLFFISIKERFDIWRAYRQFRKTLPLLRIYNTSYLWGCKELSELQFRKLYYDFHNEISHIQGLFESQQDPQTITYPGTIPLPGYYKIYKILTEQKKLEADGSIPKEFDIDMNKPNKHGKGVYTLGQPNVKKLVNDTSPVQAIDDVWKELSNVPASFDISDETTQKIKK